MNEAPLLSAPLPHADSVGPGSIDERIRRVEQRLVERERALGLQFATFGRRLRAATRARRMMSPALGIGVAVFVLWRLLRRRALPLIRSAGERRGVASRPAVAGMPWANWLALAWPLLPAAWRTRISPASAATLVTLGIPLAQRLLARPAHPPLATMAQVDLDRYVGRWYEIARLPTPYEAACDDQPSAHYERRSDGLQIHNQCTHHGAPRNAFGVAHVVPNSGNAKLRVSFWPAWLRWLPLAWDDYWVLNVDDTYQVAMVGHPDRRHLWLLSRQTRMHDAQFDSLVRLAAERGFPVERLMVARR